MGLVDGATDALFALVEKLDEALAAGAAEDFVGDADLRRPIELSEAANDL